MPLAKLVLKIYRLLKIGGEWVLCISCLAAFAHAQSIDISAPTAVQTNEVSGTISPRDIGDARLTDHFYAFTGTPGDLLITVDSGNLNGDVDVFTSIGLRPLMKFSLYAGSSSPVTKSIYLRKREDLILRVEARTPNDDDGSYRLRFGGSFDPITSGPLLAISPAIAEPNLEASANRKGTRVSSVGARLPEPPPTEVAASATPAESADTSPTESPAEEAKPAVTRTPTRTRRGRRSPGRQARTPQPATTEETTAGTENKTPAEEVAEAETPRSSRGGRAARRRAAARKTEPPAEVQPEPESGPRLIIETNDGTLINRYMSTVRRVTVENGRVVVVGKDGKIERIDLASIVRMSIAP